MLLEALLCAARFAADSAMKRLLPSMHYAIMCHKVTDTAEGFMTDRTRITFLNVCFVSMDPEIHFRTKIFVADSALECVVFEAMSHQVTSQMEGFRTNIAPMAFPVGHATITFNILSLTFTITTGVRFVAAITLLRFLLSVIRLLLCVDFTVEPETGFGIKSLAAYRTLKSFLYYGVCRIMTRQLAGFGM